MGYLSVNRRGNQTQSTQPRLQPQGMQQENLAASWVNIPSARTYSKTTKYPTVNVEEDKVAQKKDYVDYVTENDPWARVDLDLTKPKKAQNKGTTKNERAKKTKPVDDFDYEKELAELMRQELQVPKAAAKEYDDLDDELDNLEQWPVLPKEPEM